MPVHIHCNDLGVAGNVATTLATMQALSGRRAHFTHVQFHAYAAAADGRRRSGARALAEYINAHPEVSADVGQVMFGPATTLTADGAVEYLLYKSSGRKWVNSDIELETGCGIVPHTYREKQAVAALQWVVGLELFLLAADPWRVVLSTDHPNGGSFLAYPELMRLLMDRTYRDDCLKRVNPALLDGSALADGLARRVHAERDRHRHARRARAAPRPVATRATWASAPTPTSPSTRPTRTGRVMFATPRFVVKGGVVVVEEGQLRRAPAGRRLHVRPDYDRDRAALRDFFDRYATVAFDNYPVPTLRDAPLA